MGPVAARLALGAGAVVLLLTALSQLTGLGPADATVAGGGLLVTAGAGAVGFASRGRDRRLALAGAALGLVPAVVLAGYLATTGG